MGNEAAQESNLPSDGLRRPAGFEDPLGYGDSQLIETEFGAVGLPGGLPDSVGLRRWKASKTWARATCSLSSWCSYANLQAFPRCGKACGGEVPHRRRRIRTVLSGPLEPPLATRSGFRSACRASQRCPLGGGMPRSAQILRTSRKATSQWRGTGVERSASKPQKLWLPPFAQVAVHRGRAGGARGHAASRADDKLERFAVCSRSDRRGPD
jgi:hypothetical protein